jgi:hypothetical protein
MGSLPPPPGRETAMPDSHGRTDSSASFDASNAPPPGPEREISDEEQQGVPPDDMDATTPLGVGVSASGKGEDNADADSGGSDRDAHREGGNTSGDFDE